MTPYFINSYEQVGPKNTHANYIVRSNLAQGQAQIHSPNISAKLLLAGSETYKSGGNRFAVRCGQFLLAAPGEPFELTIESFAHGCCFYFDLNYVSSLISEILSEDIEGGDGDIPSIKTIRLPTRSSRAGVLMQAVAKNALNADINLLATYLAESIVTLSNLSANLPFKRESTRQELLTRLEIARTFIADAGNNQISLSDIERASCLSRFHLIRLFTNVYGVPPLRFHQNLKLDKARERVKAGTPQKIVAEELGFSTVSSFSRAYRRRHSCSPSIDQ